MFRFVVGAVCILVYAGMYYAFDEILQSYDTANGKHRKAGRRALMVAFWPFVYPEMLLLDWYREWKKKESQRGK